jgi:UDP-glucose 4-epimerase
MTMRVLIAGGLGFVGGRIAAHLAQAGCSIVLGSRKAIDPPAWLPQAKVAQINWEDAPALERCCKGVDIVIQAAGMNAQDCAADPVAALAFNGLATARLVAAAAKAGVKRFIYLSTAHVYASPLVGTITEETCPRNLHPYATSHLVGEQAVLAARNRGQIQSIVLRLSNAFGAPMHKDVNCWTLLVNDLCRQAVQNGKLILNSSGQQQRDFIGMNEVCHVIEQLVINKDEKDCQSGIFNVGAGVSESVLGMTKIIQQRCVKILGFEPDLQRQQDLKEESHAPLIYQSARLDQLTMNLVYTNYCDEIDKLLRYCETVFSCTKELKHE